MKERSENSIFKKSPILVHFIIILLTAFVAIYITLALIDIFTEHGEYKVVPNVKNMPLNKAVSILEKDGFKWEISDSIYTDARKPGDVVEQNPKADAKVKSSRTIYISINALSPRMITFPNILDISERQAQALLIGQGFKNIRIESVQSPFKGLVMGAKINGLPIAAGKTIPASSTITVVVGNGEEMNESTDSLAVDNQDLDIMNDESDRTEGVDFMQ